MKRLSVLLCVLLAILISYGGSGISYVTYCCSYCRTIGIEKTMEKNCCAQNTIGGCSHEEKAQARADANQDKKCSVNRISFYWNYPTIQKLIVHPIVLDLFTQEFFHMLLMPLRANDLFSHDFRGPLILYSPRGYLSLLTILLI